MAKERKLMAACFLFLVIAALLANPFDARALELDSYAVKYFDADTNELIYSEIKSRDEAASSNFVYEPPYIFQNEEGEIFTLDADNPRNRFVISPFLVVEEGTGHGTGRQPFCIYYKKGAPEKGKTAVKVRMFTRDIEQVKQISAKYVDQLPVGGTFVYKPDNCVETWESGPFDYIFDENDAENQLEITGLSEDVEENVLNVYYKAEYIEVLIPYPCEYRDVVTGELLKETLIVRKNGVRFEIEPEALLTTEEGNVYVFEKADARNVLNTDQLKQEDGSGFACYYRQQIEIRFDAAGGQCAVAAGTFQRGLSVGTLPVPTRKGHLFTGWYAGGVQITDNAVASFDKNQTLYAGWSKIRLKQAAITKAAGQKKGRLQLKWKKTPDADGYEISYAKNAKFKKAEQKETKACDLTLKKLKKGKTYYVKVRAYRFDSTGQKVYGKFSKRKKVKVR